jgi:hypothetical protein
VGLAVALILLSLTALGVGHRFAQGRSGFRLPTLDLTTWARIAGDLEGRVPARFLLGAPGPNDELDALLLARGVRRADFQRAASAALIAVGESTDAAVNEALFAAFAAYPLPEGIEIPVNSQRIPVDRLPEIEEARRLVLTLTARLEAPVSETETL